MVLMVRTTKTNVFVNVKVTARNTPKVLVPLRNPVPDVPVFWNQYVPEMASLTTIYVICNVLRTNLLLKVLVVVIKIKLVMLTTVN